MDSKEKVKKIILDSQLNAEDKEIWEKVITLSPEEEMEKIWEAIEKDKLGIEFLNVNLKKKIAALQLKDLSQLDAIIEEEKKYQKEL